jgi:hypothetical protein
MNIRIVTHINYEGDLAGIQEIVSDFCEVLVARGFDNEVMSGNAPVKSIVIVKENKELSDGSVTLEEFWAEEIANQVLSALPAKDDEPETEWQEPNLENEWENEGGSVDGSGSN